jgi:excisionase family DNA binding protein
MMATNAQEKKVSEMVSVAEAALKLGIKERTLRNWILSRKIAYVKLLDGAVRIRQSTIDKILADGSVEPLQLGRKRPQHINAYN